MKKIVKVGILFVLLILTMLLLVVDAYSQCVYPTEIKDYMVVPEEVMPGETVTISGMLWAGFPVYLQRVHFLYKPAEGPTGPPKPGTSWTKIGEANTAYTGSFSFAWTIPTHFEPCQYYLIRAKFYGGSGYCECHADTGIATRPNIHIIPEVHVGSIVALTSMMLALATVMLYRRRTLGLPSL